MVTTVEQIDLWRKEASEHQRLEFKEAKNTYAADKLAAYCVAIANEGGGNLLFGVTDKLPRQVVGTKAFSNLLYASDTLFRAVGFRVDLEEVMHPNGRVLVCHIPSRPRGTAYHLDGKYLMRSGESLTPMSEDRLRTIFAEGQPDWLEEPSMQELSGDQVIDLLDTQAFFELMKQPYPTTQVGVLDRLLQERLIDVSGGKFGIRRLGGLLLAKRLSAFADLARKAPRVIVYTGISKLETRIDQLGAKGYAVGFQGLVDFVMGQLPQNEIIENALRRRVKLLPVGSVRELIANCLIHQDFSLSGTSVLIEVYSNRVEFSSPGEPIVPVERFIDGYQSRNERLADIMRRSDICEEKSSGIDRVVTESEFYQLPAPLFQAGFKRTSVIVYGPKSFDDMDRDDRIRACYQHCCLRRVMSERMTNQSLRDRFGLSENKGVVTSQIIAATVEAGLIKPDETAGESRRYARYLPFWA